MNTPTGSKVAANIFEARIRRGQTAVALDVVAPRLSWCMMRSMTGDTSRSAPANAKRLWASLVATCAVGVALLLAGCAAPTSDLLVGEAWPEGDALFHSEPRWLVLVSNSVAIQTGADPAHAAMAFAWGQDTAGKPSAFFAAPDADTWLWPAGGIRLGGSLVLFFFVVGNASGGLGFENQRAAAAIVDNPDAPPESWVPRLVEVPTGDRRLFPGAAGLIRDGEDVVAAASEEPSHDVTLVRYRAAAAAAGDFLSPRIAAQPIATGVGTEASLHFVPSLGRFALIYTRGFGAAELVAQTATELDGPYSATARTYRPPESERTDVLVYAGKAHPELMGAAVVATYATNTLDFSRLVADTSLYYPRFVRMATK